MTKKILRVSSILIDFDVVWHLKGKDKAEEPKLSLSSGPYTDRSTGYKASLPLSSARGFSKTPPRSCAVLLQRPFQLLASASAGHVHRRHPFFHPWRHLCLQPPLRPLDRGSPLQSTREAAQHGHAGLAPHPRLRDGPEDIASEKWKFGALSPHVRLPCCMKA